MASRAVVAVSQTRPSAAPAKKMSTLAAEPAKPARTASGTMREAAAPPGR
ncbi:hypothetical protein [Spirillospora albida]|nr:hypothetical protein [Spirillospora albida]